MIRVDHREGVTGVERLSWIVSKSSLRVNCGGVPSTVNGAHARYRLEALKRAPGGVDRDDVRLVRERPGHASRVSLAGSLAASQFHAAPLVCCGWVYESTQGSDHGSQ